MSSTSRTGKKGDVSWLFFNNLLTICVLRSFGNYQWISYYLFMFRSWTKRYQRTQNTSMFAQPLTLVRRRLSKLSTLFCKFYLWSRKYLKTISFFLFPGSSVTKYMERIEDLRKSNINIFTKHFLPYDNKMPISFHADCLL